MKAGYITRGLSFPTGNKAVLLQSDSQCGMTLTELGGEANGMETIE